LYDNKVFLPIKILSSLGEAAAHSTRAAALFSLVELLGLMEN
jgi:hypothetical protein